MAALVAAFERANPAVRFCLFSAQGASINEKSPFRFAKAKGRAEKVLTASTIADHFIFRPGYILSAKLFAPVYRLFPAIGIDAPALARVMVDVGVDGHTVSVLENRDLRRHAIGRN